MSAIPSHPGRYTFDEYLQLEESAIEKHEFRNGQIISMAGGTYSHSLIILNTMGELRARLKGGPCRALESNMRVRLIRKVLYSYADGIVVCGAPQFDPEDTNRTTILNPRVVIELLSPSTEAYDRGHKSALYR